MNVLAGMPEIMDNEQAEAREVLGHVKWFDAGKGFGFVVAEDQPTDILLHANVLRNFGQGSIADGAEIRLLVQDTKRGAQAIEVLEIRSAEREKNASLGDIADMGDQDLTDVPLVPARVKWFDRAKGFGFANVFGSSDDIFIHSEVLRRSGLAELIAGEAVGLRVIEGKRGLMAAEVAAWDAALRTSKE